MSSDPNQPKSSSLIAQLSIIGFFIGIAAVFSQISSWGSFTSTGNNTSSGTGISILIIAIFLTVVSFITMRWGQYGRSYLAYPELASDLQGNTSPMMKVLIIMIVLFNALAIWTVFMLFVSWSWFFKTFDRIGLYLILVLWGMMDLVLLFFYHTLRAQERHESVSQEHVRKIVDYGGILLALTIICVIMWCVNHVPGSASLVWFGLLLAIGACVYGAFIVRQGVYTGQWRIIPPIIEEYREKTRKDYGELITIAVILNSLIIILFFLIASHLIPVNWGNQFGLWFICCLGGVNMIILLGALSISERLEKERSGG